MRPGMACVLEVVSGEPGWRHYEEGQVWWRPTRTLVLRTAGVIGNYDYLLDWRFERDGSIRVAVGATGIEPDTGKSSREPSAVSHGACGRVTFALRGCLENNWNLTKFYKSAGATLQLPENAFCVVLFESLGIVLRAASRAQAMCFRFGRPP